MIFRQPIDRFHLLFLVLKSFYAVQFMISLGPFIGLEFFHFALVVLTEGEE